MARLPRLYLPGCAQHVIQRGNNRQACFFDEADHKAYLSFLQESSVKHGVSIHAFVLMTNHTHLLMTPSNESGVSRLMQTLGRRYVRYINHTYQRSGTLWEGRYKSTLVDSESYLLTVYRYIELNPVRAEMVDHVSEYPWSSYRHNASETEIKLITEHESYQALGTDPEARQKHYRSLFKGRMSDKTLSDIREATNKSWVLGDDRFKAEIERVTGRRAEPLGRGGDRKSEAYLEMKNQLL